MKSSIRHPRVVSGFSLLEVLIAVVVLATGLLALAALQGSLARSSADAKVQGRVAVMLSARMDQLRSLGYGNPALATGTVATNSTADPCEPRLVPAQATDATDWIDCPRVDAGLSSLLVTQVTQVYSSQIGAGGFTAGRAPGTNEPEFKRITLTATWRDAANDLHTLTMLSDASALATTNDLLPPTDSTSSNAVSPVVRQASPVTPGMIPIAIGGGSDTAATNPKPIIVGTNSAVAETAYNVLTYHNDSVTVVKVQQRVETRVVACSCRNSSNPSFSTMLSQNYRPTYWDGSRYKTPAVADYNPPAGKNTSVTNQSDVCDQCCRDHHDPANLDYDGVDNSDPLDDMAKFDPMRTGAHTHYAATNLASPVTGNNSVYNEACRVIRVDGFWRVASDAKQEQLGYVATGPYNPNEAAPYTGNKSPDPLYADYYEEFVVDYLRDRFVGPSDGVAVNQRYASFNLDYPSPPSEPNGIEIKASGLVADARYLHGRGLYVDHVEPEAQKAIDDALTSCNTATNTEAECVLPHVPFTTVNLTQLANFDDTPDNILVVQNGVSSRGQVNGKPGAANGETADAVVSARTSNTGLTGSLPIDDDDGDLTTIDGDRVSSSDAQKFTIANSVSVNGEPFTVQLNLASPLMSDGVAVNNPEVNWRTPTGSLGCRQTADALSPNPYACRTDSTLGSAASVLVTNYHYKDFDTPAVTCPNADPDGTFQTVAQSPTPRPVCKRFAVTGATSTLGGVLSGYSVTANQDKYVEVTTIDFNPLPANALITVEFTAQSDLSNSSPQQCNYGQNPDLTYFVSSVVWVDPCD